MYPVRVLGSGLIPEGYGIAPRKARFKVTRRCIMSILNTPGLNVDFVHPVTKKIIKLKRENYQRVLSQYDAEVAAAKAPKAVVPVELKKPAPPVKPPPVLPLPPTAVKTPPPAPSSFLMVRVEGRIVSTGVTLEAVLNKTVKAKKGWLIHEGGDNYTPIADEYIEDETPVVVAPGVPTLAIQPGATLTTHNTEFTNAVINHPPEDSIKEEDIEELTDGDTNPEEKVEETESKGFQPQFRDNRNSHKKNKR